MLDITNALLTSRRNRPFLRDPERYSIYDLKGVIVHWTANTGRGANAWANRNYFNSTTRYASAHYMVDDKKILQCLPDNEVGFHVGARNYKPVGRSIMEGDRNPNYFVIGIEMCVNSDGDWDRTYKNTVELTRHLLNKYNLTIFQLWRHHDITGKDCPKMMIDEDAWQKFRKDVNEGVNLPIAEPVKRARVNVNDLNVRSGNGTSYSVVAKLNEGDEIDVFDRIGNWIRIGDEKWIHMDYVSVVVASKTGIVRVDGDSLNVRKGPGTSHSIVGKLNDGDPVEIIDSSGRWYRLKDANDGTQQWIHSNYVELQETKSAYVTSNRLIVRSGPGTNFPKVMRMTKGDVLRIFSEELPWLRIGTDQWVHNAYVNVV